MICLICEGEMGEYHLCIMKEKTNRKIAVGIYDDIKQWRENDFRLYKKDILKGIENVLNEAEKRGFEKAMKKITYEWRKTHLDKKQGEK